MSRRVFPLLAVAATAVSCTLLVPLDYTGGTEPARGSGGGQGGTGGVETGGMAGEGLGGTLGEGGVSEAGQAGATPEGGVGNEGAVGGTAGGIQPSTGGDTAAGTGGGGISTGGDTGLGGTGDVGGGASGGTDATGGMESGGGGGMPGGGMAGGGKGGRGGRASGGRGGMGVGGMLGGMSGTGVAGNADCPDADLSTDPANCGSCGHACGSNQDCADGTCISSPCDGICATWLMPTDDGGGPRRDPLNTTADVCVEVENYEPNPGFLPAFDCWNTNPPRVIQVNGVTMTCNSKNYPLNVPKRKGGYCVQATAGDYAWAGFVMPYAAADCCTAPAGVAGAGH